MKKNYHHGNLKEALILAGIDLIRDEGIHSFSLRKVAAKCGVSYAAPKNHFNDKNDLIRAMQDYISHNFTEHLKSIYANHKDDDNVLVELGKCYVAYFINNPHFYSLFFQTENQKNTVILTKENKIKSHFEPFIFFSDIATQHLRKKEIEENAIPNIIITMWSMVHGLSSIFVFSFFNYDGDPLKLTENLLSNNTLFCEDNINTFV